MADLRSSRLPITICFYGISTLDTWLRKSTKSLAGRATKSLLRPISRVHARVALRHRRAIYPPARIFSGVWILLMAGSTSGRQRRLGTRTIGKLILSFATTRENCRNPRFKSRRSRWRRRDSSRHRGMCCRHGVCSAHNGTAEVWNRGGSSIQLSNGRIERAA
jgi:hypothetical protein